MVHLIYPSWNWEKHCRCWVVVVSLTLSTPYIKNRLLDQHVLYHFEMLRSYTFNTVCPKKTFPSLEPSIQTNREYGLLLWLHRILDMYKSLSNAVPRPSRVNNLPDRAVISARRNPVILRSASISAAARCLFPRKTRPLSRMATSKKVGQANELFSAREVPSRPFLVELRAPTKPQCSFQSILLFLEPRQTRSLSALIRAHQSNFWVCLHFSATFIHV